MVSAARTPIVEKVAICPAPKVLPDASETAWSTAIVYVPALNFELGVKVAARRMAE
jgi:hypothetical protein